jgi:hypothetical protein
MPNISPLYCPVCIKAYYSVDLEDITTRPLIKVFSDDNLMTELVKRGYKVLSNQAWSIIATEPLSRGKLKSNAISPDAGMPNRGVK